MITSSVQEFYDFLQPKKPLLGLDYGVKKIGLALSNPDRTISLPHGIITGTDEEKLLKIISVISQYKVCGIVIGLPVNMDGTDSEQTKSVFAFTKELALQTELPLYLQDERLTSRLADNLLKATGLSRKKRNSRDDQLAAALILGTTLNALQKLGTWDYLFKPNC